MTPQLHDHIAARVHPPQPARVARLYAGNPTADSRVRHRNYLSLTACVPPCALRRYILVLDTRGVNVWCAAGKRTFGTRELIRRVEAVKLAEVVSHRKLILPQLGASGVAAHEVKKATGFTVEYGPVRAADLPEYLKTHSATPEMRRVHFTLRDRMVLIPVDIPQTFLPMLAAMIIAFFIGGIPYLLAAFTAVMGGVVLFPILLPILPTRDFSSKGGFLGILLAIPFILSVVLGHADWSWYRQLGQSGGYLLAISAVVAYISLNFTGASTFTSVVGVRKEIYRYIRPMAVMFVLGLAALIVFAFVK